MENKIELKDLWPVIEEQINSGKTAIINPGGVSMLPLIKAGRDSVVLKKNNTKLKKYDVALYRRKNGQFVLHRVVGFYNDEYVMCGDNQFAHEKNISHDAVLAVMTEFIRKGKRIKTENIGYKLYSVLIVFFQNINGLLRRVWSWIKRKLR